MVDSIAHQLTVEIKTVEREMAEQKHIIKANLEEPQALQAAEAEMKALHTHLTVLQGNLAKLTNEPEGEPA